MRTFTLAQIRTKVQERSDSVNASNAPSPTELNGYISASYTWLHDKLVRSGLGYADTFTMITTDGINEEFNLPKNFYATVAIERQIAAAPNAQYDDPLAEAMAYDVPRLSRYGGMGISAAGRVAVAFRILGIGKTTRVALYPMPASGIVYRIRYAAAPTDLTDDDQSLDGVSGWEEVVVLHAAIKVLRKEEKNTDGLERDLQLEFSRLDEMVLNRNLHQSMRIVDTSGEAGLAGWPSEWRPREPWWP